MSYWKRLDGGRRRVRPIGAAALVCVALVAAAACSPKKVDSGSAKQKSGKATLLIWADPGRQDLVKAYRTAHPDVVVKVEVVPNDPATITQKLQLANKAGKGWPDLIFIPAYMAIDLNKAPYDFAADITKLTDSAVLAKFSPGAQTPCEDSDKVICVRNDVAPTVLFYNKKLMQQFGYQVPTTWEQYTALGVKLAHDHPGYVVGSGVGQTLDQLLFATTKCPVHQVVGDKKLLTNLSDPSCTKVARMLDTLVKAKALASVATNDPGFVKQYGAPQKILMMPGPVFQVNLLWKQLYKVPKNTLAIAPPLKWESDDQVYNSTVGGGAWMVSRHSSYQKAAADAAMWISTGPPATGQVAMKATVFTGYQPGQAHWLQTLEKTGYVSAEGGLAAVVQKASSEVWSGWTQPNIPNVDFRSVQTAVANGKTVVSQLPKWQQKITNEAKAAGWTVVNS